MRIRERYIDENTLYNDEDAGAVDGDTDSRRDPMDARIGGPREQEQANGRAERGEDCRNEAMLLGAEAAFHDVRDEVPVQVGAVGSDADATGDEDAGEDDTDGAEGEAVHDRVDEREDFEEGVVDAVDECAV